VHLAAGINTGIIRCGGFIASAIEIASGTIIGARHHGSSIAHIRKVWGNVAVHRITRLVGARLDISISAIAGVI
jgi:hypothetical protein